jgi:hypothetical protein
MPKRGCRYKITTKTRLQVQKYYQNAVAGTFAVLLHQYARTVVPVSCFDRAGGALKRCCRETQEKILNWLALLVQKYEYWRRRRPGRRSRRRYHARTRRAASSSSPISQRPRQKEKKIDKNKNKKTVRANKESRILLLPDISAPEAKRKKIEKIKIKKQCARTRRAASSSSPISQRLTKTNLLLQAREYLQDTTPVESYPWNFWK